MEEQSIRHVLIVDDEIAYGNLVRDLLKTIGYQCESAGSARDALDILSEHHFDLVISDIIMPEKDGIQFMREALDIYPELRFIIMTGHAEEYTYSDIIEAGASDFISKPFIVGEIKAKIERIAREKRMFYELRDANAALAKKSAVSEAFSQLTRALLSPLSFDSIADLMLESGQNLTESTLGFVGYIDRSTGYLCCPTLAGISFENCRMEERTTVFQKFGGMWGWVLENRQSVLSNDVRSDSRSTGIPSGHVPIHRFLAAPALAGNSLMGIIALANANRDYTEEDLAVVEQLADVFGVAVERRWTEEELVRTQENLRQARDRLQILLNERTSQLSRAGELLRRSMENIRDLAQGATSIAEEEPIPLD